MALSSALSLASALALAASVVCACAASACAPSVVKDGAGPAATEPSMKSSSAAPSSADLRASVSSSSEPPASAKPSSDSAASAGASADPAASTSAASPPPIKADDAEAQIFPTNQARMAPEVIACRAIKAEPERIRCMVSHLLRDDPLASKAALELYDRTGDVVGLEAEQVMDGGYRGKLHLVPEPPILRERKHLEWIATALYDYETFMKGLESAANGAVIRYRVRPIALRFFRSVKARSPTAFAYDWTVGYNLAGSLNLNADAVRETMFHEMFHLNDKDHKTWSQTALGVLYLDITTRCGTKIPCLAPYAPSETVIRGGTYYAFHPENGVTEYAAELALRYYREQRAVILKKPLKKPPFKCGPEENAKAWRLLAAEFFGGVDLVPPCAPH